jgi:hypothetical protein
MTLTYNHYEIDEATIPAHNVQWMLQSTLRRLMGNQVDAALSTWIKGQANGQDPEAFRGANEAAVGRKRDELRQAMLDRILHGTLGERPRVDPLEKQMRRVALSRLRAAARVSKTKLPTAMDGVYTFADSSQLTLAEMIDGRLTREYDSIAADAKRIVELREQRRKGAGSGAAATPARLSGFSGHLETVQGQGKYALRMGAGEGISRSSIPAPLHQIAIRAWKCRAGAASLRHVPGDALDGTLLAATQLNDVAIGVGHEH